MKVELRKWTMDDCARMAEICTLLDRSYLSDQLPDPYTEDSAAWWINMALEKEGKEGVFRAILADGTVVGNISVERKQDVYRQDAVEKNGFELEGVLKNGVLKNGAVYDLCIYGKQKDLA